MNTIFLSIFAFLFAIALLVAVHEWGHYIVARMAGVKVLRFSIGFGKPVLLWRGGPDQTEYCVSAIPLGGYVKLLDEREGNVAPAELPRAFNRVPILSRIAILVAGPLANFVFAVLAFWLMYSIGVPGLKPIVGDVEPASLAAVAGLQSEDRIVRVGAAPVSTWEGAVLAILDEMLASDTVRIVVDRSGSEYTFPLATGGRVNELTEPGQLFKGLGFSPWSPTIAPVIGEITADGTAAAAGLRSGDRVLLADGIAMATWTEWVEFVRVRPLQNVQVTIERDGAEQSVLLVIGQFIQEDGTLIGRIGAAPFVPEDLFASYIADQRYGFWEALPVGLERSWSMSKLTVMMVSRIVTGDVSVKNISGPINIAQYAGYSASIGLVSFLNFLAVVSLSLGILNLLPIPVLDGGQVLYQIIEFIKGGPLSERALLIGQQIGIALLVVLMGFAFYNDLSRVFS